MALLPPQYLDAVVAIGVGDDPKDRSWVGTGFLYGLLDKWIKGSEKQYHLFLVTNRHVLQGHEKVWLKFNDTSGSGSLDYGVPLIAKNGRRLWSSHSKADVGAFFVSARTLIQDGRKYAFFRSDEDCLTIQGLKILEATEGDGAFLLGFPLGYVDSSRQYVICRNGSIARIRDLLEGTSEEFLVDAMVFPGNSGGPVITKPELTGIQGTKTNKQALLMGIVQSYIPYRDVAISQQTGQPRISFEENSGLASVVPVDYIDTTVKNAWRTIRNRASTARSRAKKKQS